MSGRKVFQAHLGFYDTVVAAPSQASALAAWGSRQNLFHMGMARVTEDFEAVAAAMAEPGVVLRRPYGSKVPYSRTPPLPEIATLEKLAATNGRTRRGRKR
jgi:colicin import membrane protein